MRVVKRAVGSAGAEYLHSPKSTVTEATDNSEATPVIDAAPESYLFPSGEAPVRGMKVLGAHSHTALLWY